MVFYAQKELVVCEFCRSNVFYDWVFSYACFFYAVLMPVFMEEVAVCFYLFLDVFFYLIAIRNAFVFFFEDDTVDSLLFGIEKLFCEEDEKSYEKKC